MIELRGINLVSDNVQELHRIAAKLSISRSWFHVGPTPHYDIICPFRLKAVFNYLNNKNKNKRNR